MLYLSSLIIDVEGFYCPQGCCRIEMLRALVSIILNEWKTMQMRLGKKNADWKMTVVGTEIQEEEAQIRRLDFTDQPISWELDLKQ